MAVEFLLHAVLMGLLLSAWVFADAQAVRSRPPTMRQCSGVSLSAAYLALVTPEAGPGFLLTVSNNTEAAVTLAKPLPTSAHWYAQGPGGRWLWRASSGAGGALVNALEERGAVFSYRGQAGSPAPAEFVTIAPHQSAEWAVAVRDNPVLRFRPGCQRCRNPGEAQFRAVLAYSYLPPEGAQIPGLLTCGLRSGLIVMPPLE